MGHPSSRGEFQVVLETVLGSMVATRKREYSGSGSGWLVIWCGRFDISSLTVSNSLSPFDENGPVSIHITYHCLTRQQLGVPYFKRLLGVKVERPNCVVRTVVGSICTDKIVFVFFNPTKKNYKILMRQ